MYQANLFDTEAPKAQKPARRTLSTDVVLEGLADLASGEVTPRRTRPVSQANPWLAEKAKYEAIAKAQWAEIRATQYQVGA